MKLIFKKAIATLLSIVMLMTIFSNVVLAAGTPRNWSSETDYGYEWVSDTDYGDEWASDSDFGDGWASDSDYNDVYGTLVLGEEQDVEISSRGQTVYLEYTPSEDGTYVFQAYSYRDTYGYVYDSNWSQLNYDDDSGEDSNFRIRYTLSAGKTYYFGVRYYSSDYTGTIPVKLTKAQGIKSITFKPITIVENTCGYWTEYNEWTSETNYYEQYYYYSYWYQKLSYTVTMTDDSTFKADGSYFYDNNGDYHYFNCSVTQDYNNKWTAGNTYKGKVTCDGISYQVDISIIENPIEKIEFDAVECVENTNGDWMGEWVSETDCCESYYYYYPYECFEGTKYKITETDGDIIKGEILFNTFNGTYYIEYNGMDYTISYDYGSQNYRNRWLKGGLYPISFNIADLNISTTTNFKITDINYPLLTLNKEETVNIKRHGKYVYFMFTPQESARYILETIGAENSKIYIYDSKMKRLDSTVSSDSDCEIAYDLKAGKTYAYKVGYYYSEIGSFNIKLTKFESPVERIEFDPISIPEYANYYWNEVWDSDSEEYISLYRYQWWDNLSYTVYMKNGEVIEDYGTEFWDNAGDYYYFERLDEQHKKPWTAGNNYIGTLTLFGVEYEVPVSITETPIESIVFNPIEIIENTNGYWSGYNGWTSETDFYDEYFYYYWENKLSYTVTLKNGESFTSNNTYFYYDDYCYDLPYSCDQSYTNQWTVGNTYYLTVAALGETYEIPISIVESPIKSVEFEPISIVENTYGYWDADWVSETDCYEKFFRYNWDSKISYTVNLKNGESFTVNDTYFYYDDNYYYLSYSSEQSYANQWTVGNTYYPTVELLGKSYQIPVTITEFPIASIEFDPIEIEEYTNGSWSYHWVSETDCEEEYFYYDAGACISKATYKIIEKDGDVIEGSLNNSDDHYIEYNGEYYYFDLNYVYQNYSNQWTVGNTYPISVNFYNINLSSEINISIVGRNVPQLVLDEEMSVQSEYEKMTYLGFTPEESGMYKFELFGDCIADAYLYNRKFNNIDSLEQGREDNIYYLVCKLEEGETYYFGFTCYNHDVCSSNVKLSKFESPIESISFNAIEIPEYSTGNWSRYWDENDNELRYFHYYWWNKLSYTVYMKNGDVLDCQNDCFYDNDDNYYSFSYSQNQSGDNKWILGDNHTVTLSLYGVDYEVNVNIVENPIASIEFNPITIFENTNGYWSEYNEWTSETDFNDEYYYYEWQDKLTYTVTLKNGETFTGNSTSFYHENDRYRFDCSATQDYHNQWTKDNTYNISILAFGDNYTVPVTIKENPIKKIEFTPIEIGEYTDGSWNEYWSSETDCCEEYYYYDINNATITGTAYTITRPNGTTATGTVKFDEDKWSHYVELDGAKYYITSYNYSQNAYEPWIKGNSYTVELYGLGVDAELKISIVERNLPKLTLNQSHTANSNVNNYFEFTPTTTGLYSFESNSEFDPYAYLYDTKMKEIASDDDGGDGNNFDLVYRLEKGVKYTFKTNTYTGNVETYTVKLTKLDFDIESVTFKPVNLIENYEGDLYTGYDDDGYYEYFRYYWWDKLSYTITLTNGDVINGKGAGFNYNNKWYGFSCPDNQYKWTIGNSYNATVSVFGVKYNVDISIIKSPIESIVVEPIYIVKETNGWNNDIWNENDEVVGTYYFYEWYNNNLSYTIKFIDGTEYKGSGRHFEYDGEGYTLSYSDNQSYENCWYPGNTYTETISALGYSTEVEISIMDEVEIDGIKFMIQNKSAIITGITGSGDKLVIPETVNGCDVTAILSLEGNGYKEIVIPDSVISISHTFLQECYNLEKITIGSGVTYLTNNMFEYAYELKEIVVSENNEFYTSIDGVLYDKELTKMITAPRSKTTKHTVPETVENIDVYFNSYYNFEIELLNDKTGYIQENGIIYNSDKTIVISCSPSKTGKYTMPDSVTEIGWAAFRGSNLTEVKISNNVNDIVYYAFAESSKISKVELPSELTSISVGAFYDCTSLSDVELPSSLEVLEDKAFVNTAVKNITIPASVEYIGDSAFRGSSLEKLTISEGVEIIGSLAFAETSLKTVTLPKSMNEIYSMAFYEVPLTSVNLGSGVGYIGSSAFSHTNLTSLSVPANVRTIDEYAFANTPIKTLTFAEGVEYIGECAFANTKLTSLKLPNSVTDITYHSFANISTLKNIDLPDNIVSLDGTTFDESAWYKEQANGVVYLEKSLYNYKGTMPKSTTIVVKSDAKLIADYAFDTQTNLKSIYIPKTVKSIGEHAFADCNGLTDIYFQGTEKERATITIEWGNEILEKATWHYSSSCPHDWKAATCTTAKTCKACGKTEGKAKGHTSDKGTVTKKATCSDTGTKTYKCTTCKTNIKTETIAKLSHSYDSGKVTKKATCKATGVKTYTCTVCKATKTSTIAKTTTHSYDSGKVTKKATCKATGVKTYTCTVCKATKTSTIAKASHSYTTTTTKATTSKDGKIVKKCSVCGNVASTTAIKYAKTIKLSATSYTYDGKVKKPTVTVKDSAGKTISSSYYTVTYASGLKNVGKYTVTVTFKTRYSGSEKLSFTINPVKTTVSKVTAGKKSLTVSVTKKSTQVTGYEIQYSTSKSFSGAKTKTISSYKTTKTTLSGLSAKKTYYVRVRTYKTVSGKKYYSAWSAAKSQKTK